MTRRSQRQTYVPPHQSSHGKKLKGAAMQEWKELNPVQDVPLNSTLTRDGREWPHPAFRKYDAIELTSTWKGLHKIADNENTRVFSVNENLDQEAKTEILVAAARCETKIHIEFERAPPV